MSSELFSAILQNDSTLIDSWPIRFHQRFPPKYNLFVLFMLLPHFYKPKTTTDILFIRLLPTIKIIDLKQYTVDCIALYIACL